MNKRFFPVNAAASVARLIFGRNRYPPENPRNSVGRSTLSFCQLHSLAMAAMADGLKERENLYKLMIR